MARKSTWLLALFMLSLLMACKKETIFKYKATCDQCLISYYDENGNFISKEPHTGVFEKEVSVADFTPVLLAMKSSLCPENSVTTPTSTTCDSALFVNDVIMLEVWKGSEKVFTDTSSGQPEQALTYEYDWQK